MSNLKQFNHNLQKAKRQHPFERELKLREQFKEIAFQMYNEDILNGKELDVIIERIEYPNKRESNRRYKDLLRVYSANQ